MVTIVFACPGPIGGQAQDRAENHGRISRQQLEAQGRVVNPVNELSHARVEAVVQACFGDLFRVSKGILTPDFAVGDFDGDKRKDLFVPVSLARTIKPTDRSEPPFSLQIVFGTGDLPTDKAYYDLRMGDLRNDDAGPYFVIITDVLAHRSSRCTRAHRKIVLVFAVNKGSTRIELYQGKKLPAGTIGDPDEDQPPPPLRGDAILLLDEHMNGTAIYWDGSRYRWYPFTPDEEPEF